MNGGTTLDIYEDAGRKIRKLRKSHGLTLAVIAKSLGITTPYLCQLENARRRIQINTLLDIALFFNVDMNYFFADQTQKMPTHIQC